MRNTAYKDKNKLSEFLILDPKNKPIDIRNYTRKFFVDIRKTKTLSEYPDYSEGDSYTFKANLKN